VKDQLQEDYILTFLTNR